MFVVFFKQLPLPYEHMNRIWIRLVTGLNWDKGKIIQGQMRWRQCFAVKTSAGASSLTFGPMYWAWTHSGQKNMSFAPRDAIADLSEAEYQSRVKQHGNSTRGKNEVLSSPTKATFIRGQCNDRPRETSPRAAKTDFCVDVKWRFKWPGHKLCQCRPGVAWWLRREKTQETVKDELLKVLSANKCELYSKAIESQQ